MSITFRNGRMVERGKVNAPNMVRRSPELLEFLAAAELWIEVQYAVDAENRRRWEDFLFFENALAAANQRLKREARWKKLRSKRGN